MWVILLNSADWDCFKTLILLEILKIQNPLLEEHCIFGSHTFVPISWMCKKQTSVSHSSTESDIISLGTGLRLDGLLALELWDLVVAVLGNTYQSYKARGDLCPNEREVRSTPSQTSKAKEISWNDWLICSMLIFIPSHVQSSHQEVLLYVFEDNEAVIKMIIKGRSRTCFQNPQSCSWFGCSIESVWTPKNPNQVHRH